MYSSLPEAIFFGLVAHAVADYALQPQEMIYKKDPLTNNLESDGPWWWTMTAHALINGGAVALMFGLPYGLVETVVHWVADWCKCVGKLSAKQDQFIHIACKVIYACLFVA